MRRNLLLGLAYIGAYEAGKAITGWAVDFSKGFYDEWKIDHQRRKLFPYAWRMAHSTGEPCMGCGEQAEPECPYQPDLDNA
jgi:hypothetical protein